MFRAPSDRCPRCGATIIRMESGVVKTSTVFIASDGVRSIYPSLRDVPEPLRRRLVESTSGRNSGTILIADRRGKEEIEKAARVERTPRVRDMATQDRLYWHRLWPGLVALLVVVAGIWLAFLFHW
jgi:hypothetical protein